jgi:hypothetical protein
LRGTFQDSEAYIQVYIESPNISKHLEKGTLASKFRLTSQYKSISNRLKPTARRLLKQSPELSSSNFRVWKHAAEKETPGTVT